jgi:hypothetical protein
VGTVAGTLDIVRPHPLSFKFDLIVTSSSLTLLSFSASALNLAVLEPADLQHEKFSSLSQSLMFATF